MTDIVERLRALKTGGMLPVITEAAAEIERLNADLKKYGDGQVEAWAARDQYMESNVKLVAAIERLQGEIKQLHTKIERLPAPRACTHGTPYVEYCDDCARNGRYANAGWPE